MSGLVPELSERDHVEGSLEAPLQLVEYGDYECPFCGEAYSVVKALAKALGERLCFAFRNFPLATTHPHAMLAAEAAEAAAAQGQFWPMHDRLYDHQRALTLRQLVGHARALGLDVTAFERDLRQHRFNTRVRADFRSGLRSGVNGTPTFFINGVRHDGGDDYDSLLAALTGGTAATYIE
jgi:protein-disulfide isomerase